ncbi:helix-turn-helix transcriptional regulator [Amycolatopsis sp.]|jgi:transcriptional regulator with XRE-family HTH domain|uniref:helix-turn-helix domain-containing protein n=1 Tax=Amycolatopsis sp. TaxID=37632 RepID=UPI002DFB2BD0|nr:helix-turn-helix transcriptional regulator [Amycolatopsis sp.]
MNAKHGTARMRSLATELVKLRGEAGLNTRSAAKLVGMSASTLNRLENGGKVIEPEDVSALLVAYGVTGPDRDRLLNLSREPHLPGWWETSGTPLPQQLPALIRFESEATQIIHASMLRVPGLMQTAEYARAVMTSGDVTEPETETMVATRLGRQAILSRPKPPHYLAIIDEAVLRRPVGGPEVMVSQVRRIMDLANRPHVEIRILPFSAGTHTGLDGTYVILEFFKARTIVYLEHKRSSLFLDEANEVAPFHEATDTLIHTALGPGDSLNFLGSVADDYGKG